MSVFFCHACRMTIPTKEPLEIVAGDTLKFEKTLADYPASSGWNITYTLLNGTQKHTFTSSANGDKHLVNVSAATTAAYVAGAYDWTATIGDGTDRYTIGTGRITIKADPTVTSTLDARTNARKTLEALEAAYLTYLNNDQGMVSSYNIAGRSMTFKSSAEIIEQIEYWKREVKKEEKANRIKNGLKAGNRVLVRFN